MAFLLLAFRDSTAAALVALLLHIDELIDSDVAENTLTDDDGNVLF